MTASERLALRVAACVLCAAVLDGSPAAAQPSPPDSAARLRGTVFRGIVTDTADLPLAGASVELSNRWKAYKTDDAGRFSLPAVPRGEYRVAVRRVGFRPQYFFVEAKSPGEVSLHVRLAPVTTELATVVVNGERRSVHPKLVGFYARKDGNQWAGAGSLFDRKDIEKWNPVTVSDLVRQANGVTVGRGPDGQMTVFARRGCPLTVFMDGQATPNMAIDQLPIHWVEGIEVYPSLVSAPAELRATTGTMCGGALAIWTRNRS